MNLLTPRACLSIWTRKALWYSPFRRFMYYRYAYNFTPEQLCYFVNCLNKTRDVEGAIYEIGCAAGNTTVFLKKHMDFAGINKEYVCIDTFEGFLQDDVLYEISSRGKRKSHFTGFRSNDVKWFSYMLAVNGISRVRCIKSDVKNYSFTSKISFCLVDVDLYKPTLSALHSVWASLSKGGIVIVDDCKDQNQFDGAYNAYVEFTKMMDIPRNIILDKLGLIEKY